MRLNNVVFASRNHEKQAEFYKRLTGWPTHFENRYCTFIGRGKPYLVFHPIGKDTEVRPPEGCMCLDFEVADLDAERERLETLGVAFESRDKMLILRDPAGNLVEITADH